MINNRWLLRNEAPVFTTHLLLAVAVAVAVSYELSATLSPHRNLSSLRFDKTPPRPLKLPSLTMQITSGEDGTHSLCHAYSSQVLFQRFPKDFD